MAKRGKVPDQRTGSLFKRKKKRLEEKEREEKGVVTGRGKEGSYVEEGREGGDR